MLFVCFRYAKVYKPFLQMLSLQTEKRLQTLAQKDISLKVYARELDRMKELASDVALLPVFVPMKMMLMDCSEINQVHYFIAILPDIITMYIVGLIY